MPRREGELVEVVLGRLDLAIVAHVIAEPDERVFHDPPDLRYRVQPSTRRVLAGKGDVDALLDEPPVQLGPLERGSARGDGRLEPLAHAVQQHSRLPVADLAQGLLELTPAAEEANACRVELVERRGGLDGAQRVALERLGVHHANGR